MTITKSTKLERIRPGFYIAEDGSFSIIRTKLNSVMDRTIPKPEWSIRTGNTEHYRARTLNEAIEWAQEHLAS
jgi:hypothetical protein